MNSTRDTYWKDFEALARRVAALERSIAGEIPTLAAAASQINMQYVDDIDGKLYFKDSAGVSHALY